MAWWYIGLQQKWQYSEGACKSQRTWWYWQELARVEERHGSFYTQQNQKATGLIHDAHVEHLWDSQNYSETHL